MSDYYCPNCNADLEDQLGFDPYADSWTCEICGALLINPDSDDEKYGSVVYSGVRWYCDECGACLNYQSGFEDYYNEWMCTECCHINPINEDEIYASKEEYEESVRDQSGTSADNDDDSIIGSLSLIIGSLIAAKIIGKIRNKADKSPPKAEKKARYEDELREQERLRNEQLARQEFRHREQERIRNEMLARVAEQREQEHIRSEKRRIWRKEHKKGITICILTLILAMLVFVGYCEYGKIITIGYSSESLQGQNYAKVVQTLKKSGFLNIETKKIADLTVDCKNEENMVTEVNLLSGNKFSEKTRYPSKFCITVVYHTLKLYKPPLTSQIANGMNYLVVISEFENAGFMNVSAVAEYDLIIGWIKKDGDVDSVSINGNDYFTVYDEFRPDSKVVITYHTLKKNKPKG